MTAIHRVALDSRAAQLANGAQSAITDALADVQPGSSLRSELEREALLAALIVHEASLDLADGGACPVEARLFAGGGIDLDGSGSAPAALSLAVPISLCASALRRRGSVAAAVLFTPDGDCAAAAAGIAPHPLRARQTETALRGRKLNRAAVEIASETLRGEAQPYGIGDLLDGEALDALVAAFRSACEQARARLV